MKNNNKKELFDIFITFFKIGAFTIGGGLAMLPLIEREVVYNKKWAKQEEIEDIFAIVQSVPGVIAINSSIFIGYKRAKLKGAFVAALGVILPSFLIILLVYWVMFGIQDNIYVKKAFAGAKAGVTSLLLLTLIKLSRPIMKKPFSAILAILSFTAIVFFNIHAFIIIIAGGLAGYIVYVVRKVRAQ
ncbi:MAG: chromate transporter [Clostridiaceae bacterium]|nr:chromate transporter [Clostridiaceae bacterium]